ncbi:MAG: RNase adapter RapZ [Deltaproteobacteria bacterium]|nr:RNase adapter RapZ [Deltaproteobacteria bacterium]
MSLDTSHIRSLILVAGMSGAGKSHALDTLEDRGFYILDNLPVPLFRQFIEFSGSTPAKYERTALLLDIDTRDKLAELNKVLDEIDPKRKLIKFVFLEATNETIVKRYSETRRPHPGFDSAKDKSLEDTIQRERSRLQPLREIASIVIDTSNLSVHELRRELGGFVDSLPFAPGKLMRVNFLSFGFKYGLPIDCDLVIDVRFLPNPHFVESLREKTGLEPVVRDYVLETAPAREFTKLYSELLAFLLPQYAFEGKSYLNIGVGCTGGQHRSVAIAEALQTLIDPKLYLVSVKHRDL